MSSSVIGEVERILVALGVSTAVTFVAVLVTPPCSDLGGADNPFYCLGGFGGMQKVIVVLIPLWIGTSLVLSWRDAGRAS